METEKYNKIRRGNEINFFRDLIKELEKFFRTEDEKEKLQIAEKISRWGLDPRDYSKIPEWMKKAAGISLEDNSKCSKDAREIDGVLSILHHYEDNPKPHSEYLKEILQKAEKSVKNYPKTL